MRELDVVYPAASQKDMAVSTLPEPPSTETENTGYWGSEVWSSAKAAMARFSRQAICVLINTVAIVSLALGLLGFLIAGLTHTCPIITSVAITLQGVIVLLHSAEIIGLVSSAVLLQLFDVFLRRSVGIQLQALSTRTVRE